MEGYFEGWATIAGMVITFLGIVSSGFIFLFFYLIFTLKEQNKQLKSIAEKLLPLRRIR